MGTSLRRRCKKKTEQKDSCRRKSWQEVSGKVGVTLANCFRLLMYLHNIKIKAWLIFQQITWLQMQKWKGTSHSNTKTYFSCPCIICTCLFCSFFDFMNGLNLGRYCPSSLNYILYWRLDQEHHKCADVLPCKAPISPFNYFPVRINLSLGSAFEARPISFIVLTQPSWCQTGLLLRSPLREQNTVIPDMAPHRYSKHHHDLKITDCWENEEGLQTISCQSSICLKKRQEDHDCLVS